MKVKEKTDHRYSKHIYLTKDTGERFETFLKEKYGSHHAVSLVVQQALNRFMDEEEQRDKDSKRR